MRLGLERDLDMSLQAAHCTSVIADVPESVRKSTESSAAGKLNMLYSTSLKMASRSSGVTLGRVRTITFW